MPARFITPYRHPTQDPLEISKQLDEIAQGVQQLAFQQTYIQATEPQIANAKIVLWRDTVNGKSFLVIRFLGEQYKIELGASSGSTGSPIGDFNFQWPHIISSTNHEFFPGGVTLAEGGPATIRTFQMYLETGPIGGNTTFEIHNGGADISPYQIVVSDTVTGTPVRVSDLSIDKLIEAGNDMEFKINGASNDVEFIHWARFTYI